MTQCDKKGSPLIVVIRVTTACGLACRYCGFSREVVRPRNEIDAADLLNFGKALSDYQSATGRPVLVSWLGGEPYQWSQLWRISQIFHTDLGLSLGVTTNGLSLASALQRERTLEYFDELTLSVDGLANEHDHVRQTPRGYAALRANCLSIRAADDQHQLWIRANMVLMRSNIEHFADACYELAGWGVDEVTFNQLGGNDRPEFYPENRLLPHQVATFHAQLSHIRSELAGHGLQISGTENYLRRIKATTSGTALPVDDCLPGSRFLFVDERSRVSPCSFTSQTYSLGLNELTSAEDIAAIPQRLAEQRAAQRCGACTDCHATHLFDKFDSIPLTGLPLPILSLSALEGS